MLCSSSAKDNLQCKLTAVIRRQTCSMRCSVAVSYCMDSRSLLFRFSYSYIIVALAQFPGVIIFEDTLLCSGHVRKRFLLVSLRLAKCAPWRSCCCCAMYIIAHLLKLIVVAAVDVFAEELVELMAESLDLLFEL